jgi:hypothetical protein
MKKFLVTILLAVTTVVAMSQTTVVNDANAVKRDVSGFTAINVSNAIDLFLNQGNEEAVAVSASEEKYRNRIKTEVNNGTLRIWFDNEGMDWIKGNKKLRAYVSFKTLNKLTASGASDVLVNGAIKSDNLGMKLSGASDFKGELQAGTVTVEISGASDITVQGSVNNLTVDASGASDFKGYDLVTQVCNVEASGASDIKVTCNKELNATASGSSDIRYKGNAVIKKTHNSGSSSVKKV